jgi:hypothetical protein
MGRTENWFDDGIQPMSRSNSALSQKILRKRFYAFPHLGYLYQLGGIRGPFAN